MVEQCPTCNGERTFPPTSYSNNWGQGLAPRPIIVCPTCRGHGVVLSKVVQEEAGDADDNRD